MKNVTTLTIYNSPAEISLGRFLWFYVQIKNKLNNSCEHEARAMHSSAIRFSVDLPRKTALNFHGSDQAFTVSGITDYHFLLLNCSQTGTLHRIKNRKCIKSLISSEQNTKAHMHPSDN